MTNPLREFRKSQGLTQQALGERLGVTQAAVTMWETRRRSIGIAELSKLQAMGADIVAIVKWSSAQPKAVTAA